MEEIFLKTPDNIKIALNYYNSGKNSAVIICPGWFMTKDSAIFRKLSEDFAKYYDVAALDFRGTGRSAGLYTFTSKEEFDLRTTVDYLKTKNYKNIYPVGFSLGGAIVINYAAKYGGIDKIIAISAPVDFWKIENHMYSPDAWIPTLFQKFEPLRWLTIRAGNPFASKIRPVDSVKALKVPALFIAGEKDPTVCPWHTEKLYNTATCPKTYKLFVNARHAEDIYHDFPEEFINTCVGWLN